MKTSKLFFIFSFPLIILISGCATAPSYKKNGKTGTDQSYHEEGIASWYGGKFEGRKTANGERYSTYRYTCAHRTLPFGSKVIVTNLSNGKKVTLRVNDRGPRPKSRIIDVSYIAARDLNFVKSGTTKVRVVRISDEL